MRYRRDQLKRRNKHKKEINIKEETNIKWISIAKRDMK